MHISPVSFKGTLTISKNIDGRITYQEQYHTSKKQDEELFNIAQTTLQNLGFRKDIKASDVTEFREKIEEITNKPLKQFFPKGLKILAIGGVPEDITNAEKYNSAYKKIFYKEVDEGILKNSIDVTVDALEPEERKEAARVALKRIQQTLRRDYHIGNDSRLEMDWVELSNKPIGQFQSLEKILTKTLFYLDGNVDMPDPIFAAPRLINARQAYLALVNRLQEYLGTNLEEKEFDEAIATFNEEKMESMKRAVGYLILQKNNVL